MSVGKTKTWFSLQKISGNGYDNYSSWFPSQHKKHMLLTEDFKWCIALVTTEASTDKFPWFYTKRDQKKCAGVSFLILSGKSNLRWRGWMCRQTPRLCFNRKFLSGHERCPRKNKRLPRRCPLKTLRPLTSQETALHGERSTQLLPLPWKRSTASRGTIRYCTLYAVS